jgi:hypothetical protein
VRCTHVRCRKDDVVATRLQRKLVMHAPMARTAVVAGVATKAQARPARPADGLRDPTELDGAPAAAARSGRLPASEAGGGRAAGAHHSICVCRCGTKIESAGAHSRAGSGAPTFAATSQCYMQQRFVYTCCDVGLAWQPKPPVFWEYIYTSPRATIVQRCSRLC